MQRPSKRQQQLQLASRDPQLEDVKLNRFRLFDYLLGDRLEQGVLRASLELDAVAHPTRHEVRQDDESLRLDQCRSQFDLHGEDVQLVAALLFRNDANHR
jgi:hypothetical protein